LRGNRVTLPLAIKEERLSLEKKKADRVESEKKLKKLRADRAGMNVKSPAAGVVYYGRCVRGKFNGATSSASSLRPGGSISANDVFMTIVKPRPMFVRATVPEKELHNVRAGLKGTVRPTGFPEMKISAILDDVSAVPFGTDTYEARVALALGRKAEALMPGMTCKVKLTAYRKKDAITLPAEAVFPDELDDQKHHVYVLNKKGKHKKRHVKVGRKTAKQVEILKGLSEGQKVLLERPEEKP
jgi:RND family efflux transporter MFP subunit